MHVSKPGTSERSTRSSTKNDFIRLLSAFCASSYLSEHFSFREVELSYHLTRAMKLTDVVVKEKDFVRDMTTSTSLLLEEGNAYTFSHRSFQEYFCANDDDVVYGIEAVSQRYDTDTVLDFVHSINAERFEVAWVIPKLSAIVLKLQKGEHSFAAYRKLFASAEGKFLCKLRELYSMNPSNDVLGGAIAAWHDMKLPDVVASPDNQAQWNLFLKDISNFEQMFKNLTKNYNARAITRRALFDAGGVPSRSKSKMTLR
jgi:hypothetical protein